jgi:hypothetical protein
MDSGTVITSKWPPSWLALLDTSPYLQTLAKILPGRLNGMCHRWCPPVMSRIPRAGLGIVLYLIYPKTGKQNSRHNNYI